MSFKQLKLNEIIAVLAIVSLMFACGGGGDDDNNNESPEQIAGEMFLGGDDIDYMMPHLFVKNTDQYIMFRNSEGIYFKNLSINGSVDSIPLQGSSAPSYAVNQYALNDNYFVWNASTTNSYRYQWATNTTQVAKTDALAPGFCITKDSLGQDILAATHRGGYLYTIKLSKFTDTAEISSRASLFDPENNNTQIQVQSFACVDSIGYVGAQNGKLYSVNLRDATPSLVGPLAENESFNLLQISGNYLVWVNAEGDIKMLDTNNAAAGATLAVDVFAGQSTSNIRDLRIFDNILIWSDDSEGNFNLWGANLDTMKNVNDYVQITKETGNEKYPFIYDGKVYWQDDRNGGAEIYYGALPAM